MQPSPSTFEALFNEHGPPIRRFLRLWFRNSAMAEMVRSLAWLHSPMLLAVPSVIISGEPNYMLNPAHPDFKKIIIGKPEAFTFDPRLLT